jgi:hypothetical protein
MILEEIQQKPLNLAQRKYIIEQGIEELAKKNLNIGPDLRKLVNTGFSNWEPQKMRLFLNALTAAKGAQVIDYIETL